MKQWQKLLISVIAITTYSTVAFAEESNFFIDESLLVRMLQKLGVKGGERPFSDVVADAQKTAVNLVFLHEEIDGDIVKKGGASAFIAGQHGLLVTSKHVVRNDKYKDIILKAEIDGRMYDARIASMDPLFDIALLEVDETLHTPDFASLDTVRPGDDVFTLGYALGEYESTLSRGVLSAKNRTIVAEGDGNRDTLAGVLQSNMPTSKGFSGGALFNERGEIIGMNAAVDNRASSLSFAIPSMYIQQAIDSYQRNGRILRAYFGMRFATVTPAIAATYGLETARGALILGKNGDTGVVLNGPAHKANLQQNDVILRVDGFEVDSEHNLLEIATLLRPKQKVSVEYMREGNLRETILEVGHLPMFFSEDSIEFLR